MTNAQEMLIGAIKCPQPDFVKIADLAIEMTAKEAAEALAEYIEDLDDGDKIGNVYQVIKTIILNHDPDFASDITHNLGKLLPEQYPQIRDKLLEMHKDI